MHIVVATPGRLKDLLSKRKMNLDICRCETQASGTAEGVLQDNAVQMYSHTAEGNEAERVLQYNAVHTCGYTAVESSLQSETDRQAVKQN